MANAARVDSRGSGVLQSLPDSQYPTVSVVIPAKNEAKNLPFVLPRIPAWVHEVILVDGNSTDETADVARRCLPNIRVVTQSRRGKGDALQAGFAAVTGDIVVTFDADGSTDPAEIPAFVGALLAGADFAKGSRFMEGGGSADITFIRRLGNWGFTTLVKLLFGHRFSDLCYGYNALWTRVVPKLALDRDGFEIETLMNIRALMTGLKLVEVASFESRRLSGKSALRTFPDGWRVLTIIGRERFSRRVRKQLRIAPPPAHPAALPGVSIVPVADATPEVLILCGGRGTRLGLGPVTELMPKPLVKVAGRPILEHIMAYYAGHGLNRFTLCLGYGGDMVRDHFVNYRIRHNDFGIQLSNGGVLLLDGSAAMPDWKITCAETGYAALTGARIYRARKYIRGPYFLCTYGDGLTNVDIGALLAFHRQHGRIATLTAVRPPLSNTQSAARFGELVIEDGDRVVKFTEKPKKATHNASGYINGGFFVFNREILDYLSDDDSCCLERTPLERLASQGELRAFKHDGFWRCVDTLEDRDNLDGLLTTFLSVPVESNVHREPVTAGGRN
jgi:glucose-1-phosphate cytidylyltransferase